MTDMHPYAAHDLGDVFASIHDETDEDHTGRERTTPAGSLWYVADVNRYEYGAYSGPNGSHPAGSVCAYTLVCPATGAAITPYAPTTDGAPFAHIRDEMAHFVKVDLPGEAWPTLRRQLEALRDIKDEVHEMEDRHADEDTTPEDYEEFYTGVANLLRVAGLTTPSSQDTNTDA